MNLRLTGWHGTAAVAAVTAWLLMGSGCMNVPAKLKEASAAASLGNWQQGYEVTEKCLRKEKHNITALVLNGICLHEMGRGEEALASLQQAADLAPENFAAQYFYGWVLSENGRYADALTPLRKAYDLRKNHEDLLILLSRCCMEQNLPDGVRYLQALRRYPNLEKRPEVYNAMGMLWLNQGQFDNAKKNFLSAWQRDPQNTVPAQNLAVLYDQYLHNPVEAMKHYRFCLAQLQKSGDSMQGARIHQRIMDLTQEAAKAAPAVPPTAKPAAVKPVTTGKTTAVKSSTKTAKTATGKTTKATGKTAKTVKK